MTASGDRIRGFDGLRAVAFLLVLASHRLPTALTEHYGAAGAWVFFVLSGFLITRIWRRAAAGSRPAGNQPRRSATSIRAAPFGSFQSTTCSWP
jgi:peptidoglycan/LPS O-acetylase OafA/YrhL